MIMAIDVVISALGSGLAKRRRSYTVQTVPKRILNRSEKSE